MPLPAGLRQPARRAGRHRLRDRAGEPRGPLRGRRRRPRRSGAARLDRAHYAAAGSRTRRRALRGEGDHPRRHGAGGALRAATGAQAARQARLRYQAQHAARDRRPVPRSGQGGGGGVRGRGVRVLHRRRLRLSDDPRTAQVRRRGDAEPVRRSALGCGRRPARQPRPGAERLLRQRLRLLRAGARHRAGHRRTQRHQPDGDAALGDHDARPPRFRGTGGADRSGGGAGLRSGCFVDAGPRRQRLDGRVLRRGGAGRFDGRRTPLGGVRRRRPLSAAHPRLPLQPGAQWLLNVEALGRVCRPVLFEPLRPRRFAGARRCAGLRGEQLRGRDRRHPRPAGRRALVRLRLFARRGAQHPLRADPSRSRPRPHLHQLGIGVCGRGVGGLVARQRQRVRAAHPQRRQGGLGAHRGPSETCAALAAGRLPGPLSPTPSRFRRTASPTPWNARCRLPRCARTCTATSVRRCWFMVASRSASRRIASSPNGRCRT